MKIGVTRVRQAVVVGSLLGFLLSPAAGEATTVIVQTVGNPGNAQAGEPVSFITPPNPALIGISATISILVTSPIDGTPLANLGASVGAGSEEIPLPTGWNLLQGFSVPPGGCLMSVTQFVNPGNGIYVIRVVPALGNMACKWLSGDYHYVVEINVTVGGVTSRGSGLGVLSIP